MTIERRIAELHLINACEKGLKLFACADAVIPGEWKDVYTELVSIQLFEFAFHARRVNQILGFQDHAWPDIDIFNTNIASGDPGAWETSYKRALDRLVHVKTFALGYSHADHRKIFTAAESNLSVLYVSVETDFRERASISLFGLTHCFLNHVIAKVKQDFPSFMF